MAVPVLAVPSRPAAPAADAIGPARANGQVLFRLNQSGLDATRSGTAERSRQQGGEQTYLGAGALLFWSAHVSWLGRQLWRPEVAPLV